MKKRFVENLSQTSKMTGIHRRYPFGALDLEGEIPLRKLNEKIDLKPVEGPQIEELSIRGHVPGLFVHLRGDEALEFKPGRRASFLNHRLEHPIVEEVDLRRFDKALIFVP